METNKEEESNKPTCFDWLQFVFILASLTIFFLCPQHIKYSVMVEEGFAEVIYINKKEIKIEKNEFFSNIPIEHVKSNITIFSQEVPFPRNYELFNINDKSIELPDNNYSINYKAHYQLYRLSNVIYNGISRFIFNSTDYCFDLVQHPIHKSSYTKVFKNAIGIGGIYPDSYGDFFLGYLERLIAVPRDLFSMCHVFTCSQKYNRHLLDVLQIIGVENNHLHFLWQSEYVFCENLYTILPSFVQNDFKHTPYLVQSCHGPFENMFAEKVRNFYGVGNVVPYEYTMYNRIKGKKRSFNNFEEIHETFQTEFPNLNITKFEGIFKTMKENVIRHSVIKWYFSFCGSNYMNCLFMAENTSTVMALCGTFDMPAFFCCLSRNMHVVTFECGCQHHGNPISVDANRALKFVKISLKKLGVI